MLIFLDIDGVLIPNRIHEKYGAPADIMKFNSACLNQFDNVLRSYLSCASSNFILLAWNIPLRGNPSIIFTRYRYPYYRIHPFPQPQKYSPTQISTTPGSSWVSSTKSSRKFTLGSHWRYSRTLSARFASCGYWWLQWIWPELSKGTFTISNLISNVRKKVSE